MGHVHFRTRKANCNDIVKNHSAHTVCICATPEYEKMANLFRWALLQTIFSKPKANSGRLHGLVVRWQENEGSLYTKDKESDWDVSKRYHWAEVNLWNFPAWQLQACEIPVATNFCSVMSWRGAFPGWGISFPQEANPYHCKTDILPLSQKPQILCWKTTGPITQSVYWDIEKTG